jgi:hypothetical protein
MDIENEILEDAYNEKKPGVELDGGRVINFTQQIQYQRDDQIEQQCSIKRMELIERDRSNIHLREKRFFSPVTISSELRNEIVEHNADLSNNATATIPALYSIIELEGQDKSMADVVEEAAQGIIVEGTTLKKIHEAQWLSQQLLAIDLSGRNTQAIGSIFFQPEIPSEIGETCVYLYTRESFWYKLISQISRELRKLTDERIKILGPFCWLLQCYLKQTVTTDIVTVYRGLNLTEDERKTFMTDQIRFASFTSTTKNRTLAEWFGNTLLIIDLDLKDAKCGSSIAHLSNFPEEEEFLIWSQTYFDFVRYEYDNENQKHIIFLKTSNENVPLIY